MVSVAMMLLLLCTTYYKTKSCDFIVAPVKNPGGVDVECLLWAQTDSLPGKNCYSKALSKTRLTNSLLFVAFGWML